jgi:hypothetical protein
MIKQEDLNLVHFMDTPEEAFRYLKSFLSKVYLDDGSDGTSTSE